MCGPHCCFKEYVDNLFVCFSFWSDKFYSKLHEINISELWNIRTQKFGNKTDSQRCQSSNWLNFLSFVVFLCHDCSIGHRETETKTFLNWSCSVKLRGKRRQLYRSHFWLRELECNELIYKIFSEKRSRRTGIFITFVTLELLKVASMGLAIVFISLDLLHTFSFFARILFAVWQFFFALIFDFCFELFYQVLCSLELLCSNLFPSFSFGIQFCAFLIIHNFVIATQALIWGLKISC